jgi:hypothetical protein
MDSRVQLFGELGNKSVEALRDKCTGWDLPLAQIHRTEHVHVVGPGLEGEKMKSQQLTDRTSKRLHVDLNEAPLL